MTDTPSHPSLFGDAGSPFAEAPPLHRRRTPTLEGERASVAPLGGTHLALAREESCTIAGVRDFVLHCNDGTLWVTWPEYAGDAIVAAGQRLLISSASTIVVTAIRPSSMWVPPGFVVDVACLFPRRRLLLRRAR